MNAESPAVAFVALVLRTGRGVTAYGPFGCRADAIMAGDWIGAQDPAVRVTREMALHPPDDHPLKRRTCPPVGDVVEVPDAYVGDLRTPDPSGGDPSGQVVVLAVIEGPSRYAVLIGPMDPVAAEQWVGAEVAGAECRSLPLRRTDVAVDGLLDDLSGSDGSRPAVVLLETEESDVVYGPFATSLAAALYCHSTLETRNLTYIRAASVCELAPPEGRPGHRPPSGLGGGWVVRLADAGPATGSAEPLLVGPFDTDHAARTWSTDRRPVSVLPIREP